MVNYHLFITFLITVCNEQLGLDSNIQFPLLSILKPNKYLFLIENKEKQNGRYIIVKNSQDAFTIVGTNINEVKSQNENSGLSYNEVKEWLVKTSSGRGTGNYSDTDIQEVKNSIQNPKG